MNTPTNRVRQNGSTEAAVRTHKKNESDAKKFLADLRASLQSWSAARVRSVRLDTIRWAKRMAPKAPGTGRRIGVMLSSPLSDAVSMMANFLDVTKQQFVQAAVAKKMSRFPQSRQGGAR